MAELPPQPVRLHLYAGPAIALPAPQALVEALREVTIENGSGDTQSGFEHRGGQLFMAHLRSREALAKKAGSAPLSALGVKEL